MLFKKYGFFGCLYLALCVLYTKIFFRSCRIIRFPFRVTNKHMIDFGADLTTGVNCRLDVVLGWSDNPRLIIGSGVQINDSVHIGAAKEIVISDNVLIASKVFISDHNHGSFPCESEFDIPVSSRGLSCEPVFIGENVWLGENVVVLPGVRIARNSIIGASAVVTKSIPEGCIAVGNPARVIKRYNKVTGSWEEV